MFELPCGAAHEDGGRWAVAWSVARKEVDMKLVASSMGLLWALISVAGCASDGVETVDERQPEDALEAPAIGSKSQALSFPGCSEERIRELEEVHVFARDVFTVRALEHSQDPWGAQAVRSFGARTQSRIDHVNMAMTYASIFLLYDAVTYECADSDPACWLFAADAWASSPGHVALCPAFWNLPFDVKVGLLTHEYMHWVLGPHEPWQPELADIQGTLQLARTNPDRAIMNPNNYMVFIAEL
jgi:hypothetical protein